MPVSTAVFYQRKIRTLSGHFRPENMNYRLLTLQASVQTVACRNSNAEASFLPLRIPDTLGMLFLNEAQTNAMLLRSLTPGPEKLLQTAVEVEVWEGHLLRNSDNVRRTLCTYSLDNGPLDERGNGILAFRFALHDWEKEILKLLSDHKVHHRVTREMQVDPLQHLLKKRIFLVEDDRDSLFALSAILGDAGYHVRMSPCARPVVHGNYAWVDLFILDRRIPDMDGLDICRHLRRQSATKNTPVIVISAHPNTAKEALNAGATDYLAKPFGMHYLLNVVARYVGYKDIRI